MAEDAKGKTCQSKYKTDSGELVDCETFIPRGQGECSNRKRHIHSFPSGFCAAGFHEGTKSYGASGKPAKVCLDWRFCSCTCHSDIDELYTMSGKTRMSQGNPEYSAPVNHFWMPSLEERVMLHAESTSPSKAKVRVESELPEVIPATVVRAFEPTATGRAARGQLDLWVKECCDEWVVESPGFPCTPKYIAEWIARYKGIPNQSLGAVNAVFERWHAIGFATIEKKPTRFVAYTPEGVRLGLDALRLKFKTEAKRKEDLANRGIRVR